MSARNLLKWKRTLNEIKFKHSELELVKQICEEHAVDFQMFLEDYCANNDIDLDALNHRRHQDLVKNISETKNAEEPQEEQEEGLVLSNKADPDGSMWDENSHNESRDNDEMYKTFKNLFKKLALNLHPDRVTSLTAEERAVRLSMFKDAKRALDNGNYFLLLDMSDKFDIKTPKNFKQQTRWMKARIKEIDQEINSEKQTYNYVFSEAEGEEEKAKIVKNFLRQIFQI
jgi:hypothetical protein